jgi:hypothetical protein
MWATARTGSGGYPTARVGTAGGNVTGFGEDDAHEMYAVNQSGNLYRLVVTKR